jgi:NADH dehydrogenase (ubiquinone) Fe-S protein 1
MNFVVNGQSYKIEKNGLTVLQACSLVGIEIPRFCYHEKLSIAGNCRMCLVEVASPKTMKPVASCALPLSNNMVIYTNTMLVHKAREGVMEFLLANHPLDCPICDQGGECDLQDQSKLFGSDRGRFYEFKRAVEDKDWGPFVKTIMTRCIQCTRCVRYATEVAGVPSIGTVGRGNSMEIGMYIEKVLASELSGNVIDICPVGALTSKPYSFTARPWELESFETVDILDSFGARIKVDIRGREVMRIQPSLRESLNEDWISDKVRFCYDGLKLQRILQPMVKKSNFFLNCNWTDAIDYIGGIFDEYYQEWEFGRLVLIDILKFRLAIFHGSLVDLNTVAMIKNFLFTVSSFDANRPGETQQTIFLYQRPFFFNSDFFENFTFGSNYRNFDIIDFMLIVNVNLRLESPLLNLKIKRLCHKNNLIVCSVGHLTNLNFEYFNLGNDLSSFVNILKGRHIVCKNLVKSKHPMILVGEKFFYNKLGFEIFTHFDNTFKKIFNYRCAPKFIFQIMSFSVGLLHNIASSTNRKLNHISQFQKRTTKQYLCLLLNTDDIQENFNFLQKDFIVYMGHNGDASLNNVDLVLPVVNYLEKKSTHINMEGRLQTTQYLIDPPTLAAEEWMIFASLFAYVFLPSLNTYYDFDEIYYRWKDDSPFRVTAALIIYKLIRKHFRRTKRFFKAKNFAQAYFKNSLFPSFRYRKKYQGFYRNIDFIKYFDNLKHIKTVGNNYFFSSNSKNFLLSDSITKSSSILASATVKLNEKNFD